MSDVQEPDSVAGESAESAEAAEQTSAAAEAADSAESAAQDSVAGDPEVDPGEDMKAKFRDALAHKHGSSGAHKSAHGDKGEAAHSQSTGPTQKMFRRKAGG